MSEIAQSDTAAGLGHLPRGQVAPITRKILARLAPRIGRGKLSLSFTDGEPFFATGSQPGPHAQIRMTDDRVAKRIALGSALAIADSYIDGEWETDDLTSVIELGARNLDSLSGFALPAVIGRAGARLYHGLRANTRRGSRRNITAHYDIGNDFYANWLDPEMIYSSAMFATADEPLEAAQRRKFDHLARYIDLQPGDHLLEIGCGWGGFAIHAAQEYGARVTALTISPAQAAWARARVAEVGLSDCVEIRIQDYRDVDGTFDKIASIEMFEAVGERYWPAFFNTLRNRLRAGGRAGLQFISIDDARFSSYRRNPDFIQMRVFPGGMLPSPSGFVAGLHRSGLEPVEQFFFGADYAETLRRWRMAFEAAWPRISQQGFDDRFRRLWRYYLCYCEAGFRAGNISVSQQAIVSR